MESLLSLSFDNISSRDINKIRKGLRQVEGLLAQICLSQDRPSKGKRKKQQAQTERDASQGYTLCEVAADPAFREFFRLQETFEGNVASRLIGCLERLLGMPNFEQTNAVIVSTLDLLQGMLLLHPPSRSLFRQEIHMNVILDLLDVANPAAVQSQALLVLVSALLANPDNTRTFERLDGLLTAASLFRSKVTTKEVKLKAVEFFYFYLMPETTSKNNNSGGHNGSSGEGDVAKTKNTEEKQRMLGKYMSNVAELVQDLQEAAPFEVSI